jgi:hypothetical protein
MWQPGSMPNGYGMLMLPQLLVQLLLPRPAEPAAAAVMMNGGSSSSTTDAAAAAVNRNALLLSDTLVVAMHCPPYRAVLTKRS